MTVKSFAGGDDYDLEEPYSVSFSAGKTAVAFDVTIKSDNVVEENESFNLMIDAESLPDNARLGSPSTTTVTIEDDDSKLLT